MTDSSYTTQCCICKKTVDMREPENGGDEHGAELYGGIWVCSGDCWDKAQEALPQMTDAEIAAVSRDPAAALAEIASWRAACRGHEAASMAELDKMRAERDAARKSSMDHALRLDALAKELDHADAERDCLAAQVTVLRDALLAMRPGNDVKSHDSYGAGWLRRKIDAALAASAQRRGNE